MSVTDGTGLIPKPIRYRRYSALVQLVPRGMGAQTSNRKARPSGAAMAAASNLLLESMRPRLPGGVALRILSQKHKTVDLLVSYLRKLTI